VPFPIDPTQQQLLQDNSDLHADIIANKPQLQSQREKLETAQLQQQSIKEKVY
jgi:hypothetical protein